MTKIREGAHRRWVPALLATVFAVVAVASVMATTASGKSSAGTPIKLGILTDCKGAFGAFYEDDIAGAEAAFVQYAGGEAEEPEQAVCRCHRRPGRRASDPDRRLRLLVRTRPTWRSRRRSA